MKRVEKYFINYDGKLLKISLYCIFFLIISQCFLFFEQTRHYLSQVDKIEGERIVQEAPFCSSDSSIIITVTQPQTEKETPEY